MESINPTDCLVEGEEPGQDSERERKTFSKVKFFTGREWNKFKRKHKNQLFYTALRKKYPLFQLCHNDAKGNIFMMHAYYEAYTMKTLSDEDNLSEPPHNISDAIAPALPTTRTPAKRPSDTSLLPSKPAQRVRTRADEPQNVMAPPQPDKGKGRATTSLLALVNAAVQPSPRVADHLNPPQSAGNVPETAPPLENPPASVPSTSAPVDTVLRPPAPPPTVPSSEEHPPTSHHDHPALPIAQPLLQPPHPAPDVSSSSDGAPNMQPINPACPDTVDAGESSTPPDASQVPPTTAQPTTTKKPRAPRKTPQWPPPADLLGAKWAYARNWYADTNRS
ncbi:hypothetical protein BD309DRAFT_995388 [Dichomitus squalens]|uniref:Uncharacterized protein n=1 Tax=Dichomitus squalens TaxID=114155 RepID=A0A4Q9PD74_9APHY|nr:hypothetical protein BD309DRAFT_995388 [Dichomitus squalens]TBU51187.1 hypothetical protein BD310DRAFT_953383 [Dichomitus squalens]